MSAFWRGFTFYWRGWRFLIQHKSLVALAIVPGIFAFICAVGTAIWMATELPVGVNAALTWALGEVTGWWTSLIYYPLLVMAAILMLVVISFIVYLLYGLLMIPFNTWLAERTLRLSQVTPKGPTRMIRMLMVGVLKTMILLVFSISLFFLSLIPVVNVMAALGTLLIISFDMLDYSLEAMNLGLRERFRFVLDRRMLWLGMAVGLALTLPIPGLTLLLAPGAVVGATLLVAEENRR